MQENNNQQKYIQEDEIDLKELFQTIWSSKKFIIIFTSVITLLSVIYVLMKNPTPIYKGTLLVEIGEIKTKESIFPIDNPNNLKYILEAESKAVIDIPKRTDNLIQISISDTNKEKIKDEINLVYEKLLEKQNKKLEGYKNFIVSKKIGDIAIPNEAINKQKKKLIVTITFITGLIASIFLVFFMQFIRSFKD